MENHDAGARYDPEGLFDNRHDVAIFGFYVMKNATAGKVLYFIFGMGLVGFYHEFRQWRINRMPMEDQVSARLSATENKLD